MKNCSIINHKQVDYKKWDALVDLYANGLPYAYSWYLDAVCENWNIIVYGDYEAGFAFQIKKKYGLSYSLHPFLIQQLGFLGDDEKIFNTFLEQIERKVFHYHYQLNFFNQATYPQSEKKTNFELFLGEEYENIQRQYKTNTKRNLKKALKQNIIVTIEKDLRPTDVDFVEKHSKNSIEGIRMHQFKALIRKSKENNALEIYRAEIESELVAMIIFIRNKLRSVYLMAVANDKGLDSKANFLLVDTFIANNARQEGILDFEGSSIEGIARFYAGFGARATNYQIIKKTSFKNMLGKIF